MRSNEDIESTAAYVVTADLALGLDRYEKLACRSEQYLLRKSAWLTGLIEVYFAEVGAGRAVEF